MGRSVIPGASDTFEERYWSKVAVGGEDDCWNWLAAKDNGYGVIGLGERRTIGAHRAAVLLSGRKIPTGTVVRHLCNNPSCCNPKHLEVGTYSENAEDSRKAGTLAVGHKLPQTKLSVSEVKEICNLLAAGNISQRRIARMYGIGQMTVSQISTGRTWSHVTGRKRLGTGKRGGRRAHKLTPNDASIIRDTYSEGVISMQMLADVFGVSLQSVSNVVNRKYWRDAVKFEVETNIGANWMEV